MAKDSEFFFDIELLEGRYFCPVCKGLVNPDDEAFRIQCGHLIRKPCVMYEVRATQGCPYNGHLVTEAGSSNPIFESCKGLAGTASGAAYIRCLFRKGGCAWQGKLTQYALHCSECAFGNRVVKCKRCGIHIALRRGQEHVQNCPSSAAQPRKGQVASGTALQVPVNQNQPVVAPIRPSVLQASVGPAVAQKSTQQLYQQQQQYQHYSHPHTTTHPPPNLTQLMNHAAPLHGVPRYQVNQQPHQNNQAGPLPMQWYGIRQQPPNHGRFPGHYAQNFPPMYMMPIVPPQVQNTVPPHPQSQRPGYPVQQSAWKEPVQPSASTIVPAHGKELLKAPSTIAPAHAKTLLKSSVANKPSNKGIGKKEHNTVGPGSGNVSGVIIGKQSNIENLGQLRPQSGVAPYGRRHVIDLTEMDRPIKKRQIGEMSSVLLGSSTGGTMGDNFIAGSSRDSQAEVATGQDAVSENPTICQICKVDCETAAGLDLHCQTRDHQKKAGKMG